MHTCLEVEKTFIYIKTNYAQLLGTYEQKIRVISIKVIQDGLQGNKKKKSKKKKSKKKKKLHVLP